MVRPVRIRYSLWKSCTRYPPALRRERPSSLSSVTWTFVKAALTLNNIQHTRFGQHMLRSTQRLYFSETMTKPQTACVTTAWLHFKKGVQVLNWPACISDLSPAENVSCIITFKIKQESENVPLSKLQHLASSVPEGLLWKEVMKQGGKPTLSKDFKTAFVSHLQGFRAAPCKVDTVWIGRYCETKW